MSIRSRRNAYDFDIVLNEATTIADEVGWQLGHAVLSYAEVGHETLLA
jgi:hypothetical protein